METESELEKWADALAATIRAERAAAGMTSAEMVAATEIPSTVYWRIEKGTRPVHVLQLRKIAIALGTSTEDLIRKTDARAIESQRLP